MNAFNKKLSAMGLNTFDYYKDAFLEFNSNNLNKPRVKTFTPPLEYKDMDFFSNYPEAYSSYKREDKYLRGAFELNLGDIIYVSFYTFGTDIINKVEITEGGFRILEETTTQVAGLCLYEGVRKEYFELVGIPDIGLSHQLFDEFVSNYYSY